MIEYLAKTLKEMKDGCGVGSQMGVLVVVVALERRSLERISVSSILLQQVENTQLKRDVQLFEKGRVLYQNQIVHQQ
jgi:hypothetical protein